MDIDIPRMTLKTGAEMPKLGLGTWQLTGDTCVQAVDMALQMGYNHLDTADVYGNHREVAAGMANHDRESIWITSKVNRGSLHYDDVLAVCEKNLKELETDYIDLYLIHWPDPEAPMEETFRALKKLRDEGMVNDIGVSNFMVEHLTEALEVAEVPIVNNQIKFHPAHQPWDVVEMCSENEIAVTAYSPLGHGGLLEDETLARIAKAVDRSVAQVAIRWLLQQEMIVIPKASSEEHLRANLDVFDFQISPEQDRAIRGMA
ncbi:MAG: aldo/keto reductase [Armatimonadota bacterium]|jgi:2,5-diketo-D-gluconate reductase B